MKISVLTAVYPTPEEPARGTPIWATLDRFRDRVDFEVCCSLPRSPNWVRRVIQPRSYLRYPGGVDATVNPVLPASPLEYVSIPGITKWFNGRLLAHALERHIRPRHPDVILAYRIFPDGYAAVAVGRRLGIPAVIGSRGSDLKKIPAAGLIRRDTIYAVRNAAAVLCVSQDLVRVAQSLGGSNRVHLVRNGVDRTAFYPIDQGAARISLEIPPGQRLIVFVGNLIPVKGIPTLLRAIRLLRDAGEIWHAALIGEGGQQEELHGIVKQLGIAEQVRFLGVQSQRRIAMWLNACDVFCLPSESEGLANVVIEASACGRNVVATDAGGTPELLNENTGIVVPRGNAPAMADAIGRSGRKHWDREAISRSLPLSWDEVAARTIDICREVAKKYHGPV